MCAVKSPKVQQSTTTTPKPTIIRNTYLDGTDPTLRAAREGVGALKIQRTLPASTYVPRQNAIG